MDKPRSTIGHHQPKSPSNAIDNKCSNTIHARLVTRVDQKKDTSINMVVNYFDGNILAEYEIPGAKRSHEHAFSDARAPFMINEGAIAKHQQLVCLEDLELVARARKAAKSKAAESTNNNKDKDDPKAGKKTNK